MEKQVDMVWSWNKKNNCCLKEYESIYGNKYRKRAQNRERYENN